MKITGFSNRIEILSGDGQTDVIEALPLGDAPKVILSSPIGAPGKAFFFEEVPFPGDLQGVPSYVGHPSTRGLLESLGAVTDASGPGGGPGRYQFDLEVGEWYLAAPLANNPREGGWTTDTAIEAVSALKAIRVIRIA